MQWFNPRDWGIEGRGWSSTHRYYDRLPKHAEGRVTASVWGLSRTPTGFHTFFETDAPAVHARWHVRNMPLDEPYMSRATFSGLDLYAWDEARSLWQWVGVTKKFEYRRSEACLISDLPPLAPGQSGGTARKYLLYSPLRNPLISMEIGVPAGASFTPTIRGAGTPKQIVHYGSSIVHGAYASRPGMVHSSILGRMLGRSVINLGFSGSARMEEAVAHLLAELDVDLYIIDPLPNMHVELVQERAESFLRILCGARPNVPVLLVEDFPVAHAWIRPDVMQYHEKKWAAYAAAYERVRDAGFTKLGYVEGKDLLGPDNEGTLDCIHPNDYGYMNMARAVFPAANALLI